MRILINNGLIFYATWVTIATNLNLAIALTYEWNVLNGEDSAIVGLSIIAVVSANWSNNYNKNEGIIYFQILVAYFACDVFFLEKYLRYTWSPYLQLAIAFAG